MFSGFRKADEIKKHDILFEPTSCIVYEQTIVLTLLCLAVGRRFRNTECSVNSGIQMISRFKFSRFRNMEGLGKYSFPEHERFCACSLNRLLSWISCMAGAAGPGTQKVQYLQEHEIFSAYYLNQVQSCTSVDSRFRFWIPFIAGECRSKDTEGTVEAALKVHCSCEEKSARNRFHEKNLRIWAYTRCQISLFK